MTFFQKIKLKLRIKDLLWGIFLLLIGIFFGFCVKAVGFSSEKQYQIGSRNSSGGIPVPNWLLSCLVLFFCIIMIVGGIAFLVSCIRAKEYNKMLADVNKIGDPETIGSMLASMNRSKYVVGGELRFNSSILFYMSGDKVSIVSPEKIRGIETKIMNYKGSETNYICVYCQMDVLKIEVKSKNVLLLLDEMRRTYGFDVDVKKHSGSAEL